MSPGEELTTTFMNITHVNYVSMGTCNRIFLTCETEFALVLAVLENTVLPMGWDSSHETLLVTSVVNKCSLRAVTKYTKWRSELPSYNVIVNILLKFRFFPIIGKKHNQSSVSDADQEIPTIGSTDNAGNSEISFPAISVYPRVEISRSASNINDRFFFLHCVEAMAYLKIELSSLEFQNKQRSILKLAWFQNNYQHDAMFVCEWVNSGLTSHQQRGHTETGPRFKVSSERPEKRGIDLAIPGLVV